MFTLALAAMMQTAVMAMPDQSYNYADAYRAAIDEGKPLVVLVGADWCPACEQMKHSVIPQVASSGALDRVAFACVNTDRQRLLTEKLLTGSLIPQLVVYVKTPEGWKRQQLTGAQNASTVAQLIDAATTPTVANVSQRTSE